MTKQSATRGLPKESLQVQKKDKKKSVSFPNALVGNLGRAHFSAKYELKKARDLAFKQRKIDICAVRHFQQVETNMEKDKPFDLIDVRFFSTMTEIFQPHCFTYEINLFWCHILHFS
jgi:hypothetical protein